MTDQYLSNGKMIGKENYNNSKDSPPEFVIQIIKFNSFLSIFEKKKKIKRLKLHECVLPYHITILLILNREFIAISLFLKTLKTQKNTK